MRRALVITIIIVITLSLLLVGNVLAHPAWGIVIDRNNQIYFSDIETIWKIDARGNLTVFRAGVSGRHTHEITLDENGILYGVDNSYEASTQRFISALWKMTPSGEFSYILAPTHNPPKGMTNTIDRAGNRYYVGQSDDSAREIFVLKRTPAGRVTTLAGNRKAGDKYRQAILYSIGSLAFGTSGTLYFTDNGNVHKVTMDGRLTLLAGDLAIDDPVGSPMTDSKATRLFGIILDTKDTAFVADYGNRRVLKIDSGGKVSTAATAEQPWSPTGVAWRDGNLYILESGFTPPSTYATRVRKLSPDGKITVLAAIGENLNSSVAENTPGGSSEATVNSTFGITLFYLSIGLGIFGHGGRALVAAQKNIELLRLRKVRSSYEILTPFNSSSLHHCYFSCEHSVVCPV